MATATPDRFFHYQRFDESHLVSLLTQRSIRFSSPDRFNDPWDCRLCLRIPGDTAEQDRTLAWLAQMHRKHHPSVSEAKRALLLFDLKSNPAKLDDRIVQMEKEMYGAICKQYRVYCLTKRPDSALMWAHYTNSHTGICLEFDGKAPLFMTATKIEYRSVYSAYDVVTLGYEPLFTKSDDWSYEQEWRLIAEEKDYAKSNLTIKTINNFLTLPPGALKSVIIGCLADDATRKRIKNLVSTHAPDVIVRQADILPDKYQLSIASPIS